MKKIFILIFCLSIVTGVAAQKKQPQQKAVTISGKVRFLNPERFSHFNKVWLSSNDSYDSKYVDSTNVNSDGTWKLTVKAGIPKFYQLDIAKHDRKTIWTDADIYLETRGYDTAKIKIKNPPYIFSEGSPDNNFINLVDFVVWQNYQNMIAASQEQYRAGLSKDTSWVGYIKRINPLDQVFKNQSASIKVLIRAYQEKPVVLYGIRNMNYVREKAFIDPILNALTLKNPWFTEGVTYRNDVVESFERINKLKPGQPMPIVAYNDANGKAVSIGSYKGKYLLVDFWASWCGPCRKAIPRLKEIYTKYNSKGFEILGISIDKDEKAWRKAMEEEGMVWKQVLSPDIKETTKTFNFNGIPTLYFVDREGKIVMNTAGFSPEFEQKILKILDEEK